MMRPHVVPDDDDGIGESKAGTRGSGVGAVRATRLETPDAGSDPTDLSASGVTPAPDEPDAPSSSGETLGVAKTMESGDGREAAPASTSARTIPRGTMLDDAFRVEDCIGRGAMGAVYTVEHVALGRRFAAKVLANAQTADQDAVRRLQQEARAASAIDHENIVDVTHLGQTHDGTVFVVMELLRGEDLGARLDRQRASGAGPLPDLETRDVVSQILSGLAAAHAAGIVHRDLKPENVFLAERRGQIRPKIVDFGISKLSSDAARVRLTQTGQLLGTPLYMAPEQTRGESREVDGRADLYSLGILAYEMITGRHPFPSESLYEILMKHANEEPPPPRAFRNDLPQAVEDVILRAVAKDPDDRFATAGEMLAAWQAAWQGVLPSLAPDPVDSGDWSNPSIPRPSTSALAGGGQAPPVEEGGSRRWIVLAAAGALLLGGVGVALLARGGGQDETSEETVDAAAILDENGAAGGPAPVPTGQDVPVEVPVPAKEAEDPEPPPAPPPRTLTVVSSPPGATVRDGDEVLGETPYDLRLAPGASRELRFTLDGYRPAEVTVDDDSNSPVEVELRRRRRRAPPPLAPAPWDD